MRDTAFSSIFMIAILFFVYIASFKNFELGEFLKVTQTFDYMMGLHNYLEFFD